MATASVRRRIRSWSRRHSYSFFSSLGALLKHRIGTLMTVLVLGIAILLPLGLYVSLKNLDRLDLNRDEWGAITVFMSAESTEKELHELSVTLQARDDVSATELVSPEQGMSEFQQASGFGPSLEMLEENPLPWVMMVSPVVTGNVEDESQGRLNSLSGIPSGTIAGGIGYSMTTSGCNVWGRLLELGRAAVAVLAMLFGLAVIVVIANTIRLDVAIEVRRDRDNWALWWEQAIVLSGQPFLYSGLWYGLMGAALAHRINEPVPVLPRCAINTPVGCLRTWN